jgi:hypothetical protein
MACTRSRKNNSSMNSIARTVFFFHVLFLGMLAKAQPMLHLPQSEFDFGKVPRGFRTECWFTAVNVGNEPLLIESLMTTCGCDMPMNYVQEPIMPGDSTVVGYKYDARQLGVFNKTMRMITNTPDSVFVFRIKGEVVLRE